MDTAPRIVKLLGYSGAIPFVSGAAASLIMLDPSPVARVTQLYGASILSFLGAVHWGVALQACASQPILPKTAKRDFTYSVVPSLVAWVSCMLPVEDGLFVLCTSFGVVFLYDWYRFRAGQGIPSWYRRLRRPLSLAAMLGTGIAMRSMWRAGSCTRGGQVTVPHDGGPASGAGTGGGGGGPEFVQVSTSGGTVGWVRGGEGLYEEMVRVNEAKREGEVL